MELTGTVSQGVRGLGGNNESEDVRIGRIADYFGQKSSKGFLVLGKLLAMVTPNGKTLAARIAAGESIPLTKLTLNGATIELPAGFVLSMDTVGSGDNPWGCLACRSAHGTGIAPSKRVDIKLLESNKFYFNPETRHLFSVSASCWTKYILAEKATDSRLVNVSKRFKVPTATKHVVAPSSVPATQSATVGGTK